MYKHHNNHTEKCLKKTIGATAVITVLTALVGCQTTNNNQLRPIETGEQVETTDDTNIKGREDMVICTMQYEPVCASVKDGNGVITKQTFGNACSSQNAKGEVIDITDGACE